MENVRVAKNAKNKSTSKGESSKVALYICRVTKSIRISEDVHTKLKVFVAGNKQSIVEFADKAILDALKASKSIKSHESA